MPLMLVHNFMSHIICLVRVNLCDKDSLPTRESRPDSNLSRFHHSISTAISYIYTADMPLYSAIYVSPSDDSYPVVLFESHVCAIILYLSLHPIPPVFPGVGSSGKARGVKVAGDCTERGEWVSVSSTIRVQ